MAKKPPKPKKCSICGRPYAGFGNNAQPVNDGRCCDHCNWERVIPVRIAVSAESGFTAKEKTKIAVYIHCANCLRTIPNGISPRNWQQLEVGWTATEGIQIWCRRCDRGVLTLEGYEEANEGSAPEAIRRQ